MNGETYRSKNDFDVIVDGRRRLLAGGRYLCVRRKPGEWIAHWCDTPGIVNDASVFLGRSVRFEQAEQTCHNYAAAKARNFKDATGQDAGSFDECYDCAGEGFSSCMC